MTFTFVGATAETYAMDQIKNIVKDCRLSQSYHFLKFTLGADFMLCIF